MKAARELDTRFLKAVLDIAEIEELSGESLRRNWGDRSPSAYRVNRSHHSEFGGVKSIRGEASQKVVGITTPLMEAIRARLRRNVEILLEAGADPTGLRLRSRKFTQRSSCALDQPSRLPSRLWMLRRGTNC